MQKSRSHWTHREPRLISGLLLRMMIALIALCLLAQLSGCNNSRTVYVKVPVVPLPASLTADIPQPEIPDNLTWGQSLDLNVSLLSALGQCNRDKADIRQAEKNEPRNSGAFSYQKKKEIPCLQLRPSSTASPTSANKRA